MSPLVPIAGVDPIQALELSGRAATWLASVLKVRRAREEQGAAVVLREVGMLVVNAHALHNQARAVTTRLLRYTEDLTDGEKRRLVEELDAFLHDGILVPELDRGIAAVDQLMLLVEDGALHLDAHVAEVLGDITVLWPTIRAHRWGVCAPGEPTRYALRARSGGWSRDRGLRQESVAELASKLRHVVSPEWLSEADAHLGSLRATIAVRHPRLPQPDWLYSNRAP